MSLFSTLVPIIQSVFSRWTALQLAVAHSMGGPESDAKYQAFIDAFAQYLIRNVRPSVSSSSMEQDIQEYLDEILDEEFNTVLDDGSSQELAQLFLRYIQWIHQGKLADVQQEIQAQQTTAPAIHMSVRNANDDGSSSSSGEDEDDPIDNEMREEEEGESPQATSTSNESKSHAMDVDEDGWTTVHRHHARGKK